MQSKVWLLVHASLNPSWNDLVDDLSLLECYCCCRSLVLFIHMTGTVLGTHSTVHPYIGGWMELTGGGFVVRALSTYLLVKPDLSSEQCYMRMSKDHMHMQFL